MFAANWSINFFVSYTLVVILLILSFHRQGFSDHDLIQSIYRVLTSNTKVASPSTTFSPLLAFKLTFLPETRSPSRYTFAPHRYSPGGVGQKKTHDSIVTSTRMLTWIFPSSFVHFKLAFRRMYLVSGFSVVVRSEMGAFSRRRRRNFSTSSF